jgi:hypothetical protein
MRAEGFFIEAQSKGSPTHPAAQRGIATLHQPFVGIATNFCQPYLQEFPQQGDNGWTVQQHLPSLRIGPFGARHHQHCVLPLPMLFNKKDITNA